MVLVIEDDKYIRDSLQEFLSDEGYQVTTANNGQEALNILNSGLTPQVILLDLMMPIMDGFQFREQQLASPVLAPIPVVVMSAYGDKSKNIEKLGTRAYLKKPLDIQEILDTIEKWSV